MDRGQKKLVFKKLSLRLVLIPLGSLLALAGIYVIHPEDSQWILSAAIIWGVLTIVCLIIFVLRPLRSLLVVMDEIDSHNCEMQGQLREQAEAFEKIYIDFNQVNESVRHTVERAVKVRRLTGAMLKKVVDGAQQEIKVLAVRDQFLASGERFKKLIEVIRDIAYQTNLLSVDAAIGAARGGVNVKDFAEVAAEIKNLAKGVTNFSQEIEELILGDFEVVKTQSVVSDQDGGDLQHIVPEIRETAGIVRELTQEITEQAAVLEQFEAAIDRLNQITQINCIMSNTENDQRERLAISKMFGQVSFREI